MGKFRIGAFVLALIGVFTYPLMNAAAVAERGYDAFGGEEILLIVAVCICFLFSGKKRRAARPKANRPTTESEQSNNHFDA